MKKLLYIFVLILIASCSTKKITTSTTSFVKKDSIASNRIQKDSTRSEIVRTITPAVNASLVLSNPCDTTGILKATSLDTQVGKLKLNITSDPITKKIYVKANYDSIMSVIKSEYILKHKHDSIVKSQSTELKKDKNKKVVIYRLGFWGWCSIILNIILIVLLFKIK